MLRGLKIFAPRPQRSPLFRPRKEAATGMLRLFCLYIEMVDSRHTSSPIYNSQIDVLELYCLGHVLAYCGILVLLSEVIKAVFASVLTQVDELAPNVSQSSTVNFVVNPIKFNVSRTYNCWVGKLNVDLDV